MKFSIGDTIEFVKDFQFADSPDGLTANPGSMGFVRKVNRLEDTMLVDFVLTDNSGKPILCSQWFSEEFSRNMFVKSPKNLYDDLIDSGHRAIFSMLILSIISDLEIATNLIVNYQEVLYNLDPVISVKAKNEKLLKENTRLKNLLQLVSYIDHTSPSDHNGECDDLYEKYTVVNNETGGVENGCFVIRYDDPMFSDVMKVYTNGNTD